MNNLKIISIICLECHKVFQIYICRKHTAKFCSISCSKKWMWRQRYFKEKFSKKVKGIHNHPATEFRKGQHPSITTEFKKGIHPSINTEFKKGHKNTLEIEQKRISNSIIGNHRKTKPEIFLENLLNRILPNQYKYVGNGSKMIEQFNPDFIDIINKKIIEVFGDYWHNLAGTKKKDYYRFLVYKRNNYKTLVIWEHELKNIIQTINKIRKFHNAK